MPNRIFLLKLITIGVCVLLPRTATYKNTLNGGNLISISNNRASLRSALEILSPTSRLLCFMRGQQLWIHYYSCSGFITTSRVGSHVVSVRIHCTEKWRTSFHTDVFSKSK